MPEVRSERYWLTFRLCFLAINCVTVERGLVGGGYWLFLTCLPRQPLAGTMVLYFQFLVFVRQN